MNYNYIRVEAVTYSNTMSNIKLEHVEFRIRHSKAETGKSRKSKIRSFSMKRQHDQHEKSFGREHCFLGVTGIRTKLSLS